MFSHLPIANSVYDPTLLAFGQPTSFLQNLTAREDQIYWHSKDTINCLEKAMKISHFNHIMIELCYFSLHQWEIKIHMLWGKCFNIPHWLRSHSTNGRLQHIEELSKSKSRVGMVWLKWLFLEMVSLSPMNTSTFSIWSSPLTVTSEKASLSLSPVDIAATVSSGTYKLFRASVIWKKENCIY